jgi:hypothetical protein
MKAMYDVEVFEAAEEICGLYEVLCGYLHDEEKRHTIWSAICNRSEQIGTAFVERQHVAAMK